MADHNVFATGPRKNQLCIAVGAITKGQGVVVADTGTTTDGDKAVVAVTVANPGAWSAFGIALEDAEDGDFVKVMVQGTTEIVLAETVTPNGWVYPSDDGDGTFKAANGWNPTIALQAGDQGDTILAKQYG